MNATNAWPSRSTSSKPASRARKRAPVKSKIDAVLKQQDLNGLVVLGGSAHNPAMYYLANGASIGERSLLIKPRGKRAALVVNSMEREEAARSGLRVLDLHTAAIAAAPARPVKVGNPARTQAQWYCHRPRRQFVFHRLRNPHLV